MTVFPEQGSDIIRVFRCPKCQGLYLNDPARVDISCCVSHAPGTCCHYSDILINEKKFKRLSEEEMREYFESKIPEEQRNELFNILTIDFMTELLMAAEAQIEADKKAITGDKIQ